MSERVEVCWCVDCGARFTAAEIEGAFGCPRCGSEGVPCSTDQDVLVEVNWHELRILAIWAENWARCCAEKRDARAERMPVVVTAIARRLRHQHPGLGPLTLSEEIAALPADLAKAGIEIGKLETNIDKPKLVSVNGPGAVGHARLAT